MKTAWKRSILSVAIVLGACDAPPTAVPGDAVAPNGPTPVAAAGVHRRGNVVTAGGADADSMVRGTAARWARDGHDALQRYIDSSAVWEGRVAAPSASITPLEPPDDGSGYADLSYMNAVVGDQEVTVTVNGNQGMVTSAAAYIGTDAHSDLSFGANYTSGVVDVPGQSAGTDDGHAMQKIACGAEISFGGALADCQTWTGTVRTTARLTLSHDCGEYVYGSATTRAWFELPLPEVTLTTNGPSVQFKWKRFGESGVVAGPRKTAYQPACPTVIQKTPTCNNQLIYDPSGCDPSDGGVLDPTSGTDSASCTTYLVQVEVSYDGGRTWIVTSEWIQRLC